jgi:hypothetical protein
MTFLGHEDLRRKKDRAAAMARLVERNDGSSSPWGARSPSRREGRVHDLLLLLVVVGWRRDSELVVAVFFVVGFVTMAPKSLSGLTTTGSGCSAGSGCSDWISSKYMVDVVGVSCKDNANCRSESSSSSSSSCSPPPAGKGRRRRRRTGVSATVEGRGCSPLLWEEYRDRQGVSPTTMSSENNATAAAVDDDDEYECDVPPPRRRGVSATTPSVVGGTMVSMNGAVVDGVMRVVGLVGFGGHDMDDDNGPGRTRATLLGAVATAVEGVNEGSSCWVLIFDGWV